MPAPPPQPVDVTDVPTGELRSSRPGMAWKAWNRVYTRTGPARGVTLLLVEVTLSLLVSTSPDIEDTVSVLARLLPLSPSSVE